MFSHRLLKAVSFLLVMLLLQACLEGSNELTSTKSANDKGKTSADILISEEEDFSVRKAFFSTLTTHNLCKIAIEIEGTIAADPSDNSPLPFTRQRTPFQIVGNRVEVQGFYENNTSNNGLAMKELESRHSKLERQANAEKERQKQKAEAERKERQRVLKEQEMVRLSNLTIEEKLKERERQRDEDMKKLYSSSMPIRRNYTNAPHVSPDQLCRGTFGGKSFSVSLVDVIVRRQTQESRIKEQNEARRKRTLESATRAPSIICKSREFFGTVTTSCY